MLVKRWTILAWNRSVAGMTTIGNVKHSNAPTGMMIFKKILPHCLMKLRNSPCLDPNLWQKGSLWWRIGSLTLWKVDIPSEPDYCWFDRSRWQVICFCSSLVCQMLGRPIPDLQILLEWGNKGLQLCIVVGICPPGYLDSLTELDKVWPKKELRCPWVEANRSSCVVSSTSFEYSIIWGKCLKQLSLLQGH